MNEKISPEYPHVFLLDKNGIVGFAKVLFVTGIPAEKIQGRDLRNYAKDGQRLVSVYKVQIYQEYTDRRYQYNFYSGFEDPPEFLGDMNNLQRGFGTQIAWDFDKLTPNPLKNEVGSIPQTISVPTDVQQFSVSRYP